MNAPIAPEQALSTGRHQTAALYLGISGNDVKCHEIYLHSRRGFGNTFAAQ